MKNWKISTGILFVFLLCTHGIIAQKIVRLPQSVALGSRYEMNSNVLKEKRQLLVYAPPKSQTPQKYPLIVVFDGESQIGRASCRERVSSPV